MKPIKIVSAAGIAGALALAVPGIVYAAPRVSGEVFQYATPENHGGTLYEMKASTDANVAKANVRLFGRVRETIGGPAYVPRHFMINELSMGYDNFRVLGQARITNGKVMPQTGVSYEPAFTLGNMKGKVIIAATATVEANPVEELLVPVTLSVPTVEDQSLTGLVEQIVWHNKRDALGNAHAFMGSTRVHLGYQIGPVTMGVAGETDYGTEAIPHPRLGGFVKFTGQ